MRLVAAELREQQARDQEPGQDEERVDAEVAASRPSVPEVVRDDGRDRQRTKPVERGLIRHPPLCPPVHAPPWNTVPASGVDVRMTSIPVRRLNHAVLYVRDVERSVAFYRDVLGLEPVHDDWKTMGAAFLPGEGSENDHDLGLFAIGDGAPGPGPRRRRPLPPRVGGRPDRGPRRCAGDVAQRRGARRPERPRRHEVALRGWIRTATSSR